MCRLSGDIGWLHHHESVQVEIRRCLHQFTKIVVVLQDRFPLLSIHGYHKWSSVAGCKDKLITTYGQIFVWIPGDQFERCRSRLKGLLDVAFLEKNHIARYAKSVFFEYPDGFVVVEPHSCVREYSHGGRMDFIHLGFREFPHSIVQSLPPLSPEKNNMNS